MLKTPLSASERTYSSETERRHTLFCGTQLIQAKGGGPGGNGAVAVVTSTGEIYHRYIVLFSLITSINQIPNLKLNYFINKLKHLQSCHVNINIYIYIYHAPFIKAQKHRKQTLSFTHATQNTESNDLNNISSSGFFTAKGNLVSSIMYPQPTDFRFYQDAAKFLFILGIFGKSFHTDRVPFVLRS